MVWLGLILGIVACSSSVIFIKSTTMDPAYLAAMRLSMSSAMLMPLFLRDWKRSTHLKWGKMFLISLPAGFFLAAHFISWNEGVRRTLAVHGTLIVNMVPIALPFLLWLTHREKVNRVEIVATIVSLIGLTFLGVSDYHFSKEYVVGDLVCFGSMLLFAMYLSFGRKNRSSESIFLYIVPVYLIAAVFCLIVSLLRFEVIIESTAKDYFFAFLLALIPGTIGHTLINYSMRHLRGQVVGVMNVGQFLTAGVFAYIIFGETPKTPFYIVSIFIVASCVVAILSHRGEKKESVPCAIPKK